MPIPFLGEAQSSSSQPITFLVVQALDVSYTTYGLASKRPSYTSLVSDFSQNNILQTFDNAKIDEAKKFSSTYSGFKIAFVFDSKWSSQTALFDFLSLALETGNQNISLFDVIHNNSSVIHYKMEIGVFNITFGAKKTFLKDKRLRFFTGVDWTHEFQISSLLFEGDRKLFAKKKYSNYVSVPIGMEFRFSGKKYDFKKFKSLFYSYHFGIGLQNLDPYLLAGGVTGFSLGLSLSI